MATGNVLVCAPTGRDEPLIGRYLLKDGVQTAYYHSVEQLCDALDDSALAVIIAEEALQRHGVEALFRFLKAQQPWSDIAVILLTHPGEQATQVSSGLVHVFGPHANVNMLERPLRVPTLISGIRSAIRARKRQ
jgi:DNA-binding NtrC family response regulator